MTKDYTTSAEWREWDEGVAHLRASGATRPANDAAELVTTLATGKYDALSGSHIDVSQDLDQLLAHGDEISEKSLYRLREQQLPE